MLRPSQALFLPHNALKNENLIRCALVLHEPLRGDENLVRVENQRSILSQISRRLDESIGFLRSDNGIPVPWIKLIGEPQAGDIHEPLADVIAQLDDNKKDGLRVIVNYLSQNADGLEQQKLLAQLVPNLHLEWTSNSSHLSKSTVYLPDIQIVNVVHDILLDISMYVSEHKARAITEYTDSQYLERYLKSKMTFAEKYCTDMGIHLNSDLRYISFGHLARHTSASNDRVIFLRTYEAIWTLFMQEHADSIGYDPEKRKSDEIAKRIKANHPKGGSVSYEKLVVHLDRTLSNLKSDQVFVMLKKRPKYRKHRETLLRQYFRGETRLKGYLWTTVSFDDFVTRRFSAYRQYLYFQRYKM